MKATINRNADPMEMRGRLTLNLHHDSDGRYRWYDEDETDTEVSGETIAEAHEAAQMAWGDGDWDLVTEYLICPDCGHCGEPVDDEDGCGCHCGGCGATV